MLAAPRAGQGVLDTACESAWAVVQLLAAGISEQGSQQAGIDRVDHEMHPAVGH